jgi:hypothetical protein
MYRIQMFVSIITCLLYLPIPAIKKTRCPRTVLLVPGQCCECANDTQKRTESDSVDLTDNMSEDGLWFLVISLICFIETIRTAVVSVWR